MSAIEYQLEAHPLNSNSELLSFNVRSRNILWNKLVAPLQSRGRIRYFKDQFQNLDMDYILTDDCNDQVLVCHDMMNNYGEDKLYGTSQKWDDFKFYHWAGIDYFCYFSHHYITIPPSGWINAAHIHGVKILGTFITEREKGKDLLNEAIDSKSTATETADALVRLCKHFCFDGWLINIENEVRHDKIPNLIYFLEYLREKITKIIPNGVVIWYDSIINTGRLSWQNELNGENFKFFDATNGMLLNYGWKDRSIQNTVKTIEKYNKNPKDVFFGIDIFGRGQVAKFRTRETLALIPPGYSVGIFAPGWVFETLTQFQYDIKNLNGNETTNEVFLNRNEKFWQTLWFKFRTHSYHQLPFYTDFCLGSGKFTFEYGRKTNKKFFNLYRQSLQPSVPLEGLVERCFDYAVNGGSCLKIIKPNERFRLFATDFLIKNTLIFAVAFKTEESRDRVDCILKLKMINSDRKCDLICGNDEADMRPGRIYLKPLSANKFGYLGSVISLQLPFNLEENWTVHYYCANFSSQVIIQDIGVIFKRKSLGTAYIGAIYLHCPDNKDAEFEGVDVEYTFREYLYERVDSIIF